MEGVQTLVTEYLPVVIFLVIAAVLSVLFIVLSTLFAPKKPDAEKLRLAVHEFLLHVDILPWDAAVSQRYARVRASLERKGTPLGSMDMLIAAHALAVNAVLVTNDRAFKHVDRLLLADWTI